MAVTEPMGGVFAELDREAGWLLARVARARRNRWLGDDLLAPELRDALDALTDPTPRGYARQLGLGPEPERVARPNPWSVPSGRW